MPRKKIQPTPHKNWADEFADPAFVAYATILEPPDAEPSPDAPVEIEAIDYDDVLSYVPDPDIKGGLTFRKMRVAIGECVLAYTDDPRDAPYVARVKGIELLPRSEWDRINRETNGNPSEVLRSQSEGDRKWVELQEEKGRVPAKYFRLRVQYFYRYPELMHWLEARGDFDQHAKRVAKGLQRAGMEPPNGTVGASCKGREAERAARFLTYSNHVSTGDEQNPHVPLASVIATNQVHYLSKRENAAVALMMPTGPQTDPGAAPSPSGGPATALHAGARRASMPGFVCNQFLDVAAPDGGWAVFWLDSKDLDSGAKAELAPLLAASKETRRQFATHGIGPTTAAAAATTPQQQQQQQQQRKEQQQQGTGEEERTQPTHKGKEKGRDKERDAQKGEDKQKQRRKQQRLLPSVEVVDVQQASSEEKADSIPALAWQQQQKTPPAQAAGSKPSRLLRSILGGIGIEGGNLDDNGNSGGGGSGAGAACQKAEQMEVDGDERLEDELAETPTRPSQQPQKKRKSVEKPKLKRLKRAGAS